MGQGTGIGLSVVHGIVKSHGGLIDLDSEPGQGTRINLRFPACEGKQTEDDTESAEIIPGRGILLLVDDESAVVRMGTSMLERLGYRVAGLTDPVAALELFAEDARMFDLIITDLTMPKLTGEELAERARYIRSDIPVILTTGASSITGGNTANQRHIDGILKKPFDRKTLSRLINDVLGGPGKLV